MLVVLYSWPLTSVEKSDSHPSVGGGVCKSQPKGVFAI